MFVPAVGITAEIGAVLGDVGPSRRDMTQAAFETHLASVSNSQYRIIDLDVYRDGGRYRYAVNWRRNDGREWAVESDLTSELYSARFAGYRAAGMRATDIEGYRAGNSTRYAGVWVENRENIGWAFWRNMTGTEFREKNSEQSERGRVIVDAEAYMTRSGLRFAAIWYDDDRPQDTFFRRGISRSQYNSLVQEKASEGFSLVDYERYENDSGEIRYIGLWKRGIPGRVIVRTNRDELAYENFLWQYNDEGYRPVDFEREGDAYAGIWMEAFPARARLNVRPQLDAALNAYRQSIGSDFDWAISAAIMKDGTPIWQKGLGLSDIRAGRQASSETIYYIASISKAIAGTLFGLLQELGSLADGRSVSIAAGDPTRQHLPELPTFHNHALADLLGHTACIASYGKEHQPTNANYTRHYDTQRDALSRYMATPLIQSIDGVDGCTVGQTYTYSNHGYGMLGAAMESATGRAYKDLLRTEIAEPNRLDSIRAMHADKDPVPTVFRADHDPQRPRQKYDDGSWKVSVGSVEANAADLARFGWLVASGQIVSPAYRDATLLSTLPNSERAYAWRVGQDGAGRRYAEHGGGGSGKKTLFIWPDHGLSVAILTNNDEAEELDDLAKQMADIVLSNP